MSLFSRGAPVALGLIAAVALAACGGDGQSDGRARSDNETFAETAASEEAVVAVNRADIVNVAASGQPGAYTFNVTVRSPDTGCDRYADWWEVLSEDGELLYRRVLLHSHVDEQPFSRSGGAVPVDADTTVVVRAHLNSGGYGGAALRGSAATGFVATDLPEGFAAAVESAPPLPDGCQF